MLTFPRAGPRGELLAVVERFERGDASIEALTAAISAGADSVTEDELRELRKTLDRARSQFEVLLYTKGEAASLVGAHAIAAYVASCVRRCVAFQEPTD